MRVESVTIHTSLDPWLTMKAASQHAGLSRRTLQDAIHDPACPLRHVHHGGKILIRLSWLDTWLLSEGECKKAHTAARLAHADITGLQKARPQKSAAPKPV